MAIDKAVDSGALDTGLTSIADKIRSRSGGSNQLLFPTGFVSEIDNIPQGGGGAVEEKDVNFYDYDGTVVASYTAAEFAQLSAMPSNPTHTGLTAQGWNWSLSDAKTYVASYGKLNIGQMYITSDGKTRIYCHLLAKSSPYVGLGINGEVEIDWGDGSAIDTVTGTSLSTIIHTRHTYTTTGDYVISIKVNSGTIKIQGAYAYQQITYLLNNLGARPTSSKEAEMSKSYGGCINKIEIGANVQIGEYAFAATSIESITIPNNITSLDNNVCAYCYNLCSIVIPNSITTFRNYTFSYCSSLKIIALPNSLTSVGSYTFQNCTCLKSLMLPNKNMMQQGMCDSCYSLTSVVIPNGTSSLKYDAFTNCRSLQTLVIPDGLTTLESRALSACYGFISLTIPTTVTSIAAQAIAWCYSIKEIHLKPTTPPTLASTNAFDSIPSDCIIYVPTGSLTDYQTATNWSTYASYMQEE